MTVDRSQPQASQEGETVVTAQASSVAEATPQHDPFRAFVDRTEARLRVPNGFLFGLMSDPSDWSFCIQLHAVLESAINAALHRVIREPRLDKEIALLPIKTKLRMIQAIEVLTAELAGIVDSLGSVRNRVAHQVANIPGFTLSGHFANLDQGVQVKLTGHEPFPPHELRMRVFIRALGVLLTLDLGLAEMDQRFHDEHLTALETHNKTLSDAIAGLLDAGAGDHATPAAPPGEDITN